MAASEEYGGLVFAGKPINRADFERIVVNREDDAEVGKKVDKDIEAAVKHNRDNMRSINEKTLSEWKHSQAMKARVCWGSTFIVWLYW